MLHTLWDNFKNDQTTFVQTFSRLFHNPPLPPNIWDESRKVYAEV